MANIHMFLQDLSQKIKGDVMDLRLDIERRKRFAGKGSSEFKREGGRSPGGSRGPSRERSSEKSGKHHKKSKYVQCVWLRFTTRGRHSPVYTWEMFEEWLLWMWEHVGSFNAMRNTSNLVVPFSTSYVNKWFRCFLFWFVFLCVKGNKLKTSSMSPVTTVTTLPTTFRLL